MRICRTKYTLEFNLLYRSRFVDAPVWYDALDVQRIICLLVSQKTLKRISIKLGYVMSAVKFVIELNFSPVSLL